jgi:glycosyltransferase involved in cell wall biosynthesis
MHIAIITAGGAGMFCGSCMHDNTWARALIDAGCEVSLLPTYTPIRVDEDNLSDRRVFLGGVNVYLDYRWRLWQKLPRGLERWLDAPWVLRLASRLSARNDAARLGDLALAMLSGERGPQHREIEELARFIGKSLQPDVVIFSNALLSGALHRLRERYAGPVYCTLQGDDVFLDGLPASHRDKAIAAVADHAREFDGYFVHSRFYRDYMADYLSLPRDRFRQLPLGIDLAGHDGRPDERDAEQPFTIGYFARIAPEKGLHHLVDAFLQFHLRYPHVRLRVGGNLASQDRGYFRKAKQVLKAGGASESFDYVGSPETHEEKVAFYRSVDVVSVPTEFQEPKGLYVLEALANGRPVVQPGHGAFPELIEATGGGRLVTPRDPQALADAWEDMLQDADRRHSFGATGQLNVREKFSAQVMADATLRLLKDVQQPG